MKLGFNLFLWTDTLTDEVFHHVEMLQKLGYETVELPMFDKDAQETCKQWGRRLDDLGLLRTGTCAYGPDDNIISADPKIRRQGIDANKKILDCCTAAGCSIMAGHCLSTIGMFSGAPPTQDEWNRALDGAKEIAAHAQDVGVKIALEVLNRFECYFLNSVGQAAKFVREVNHPSFRMMYDTFHANIEEKSIPDALRSIADVLIHVHISENDRSTPGAGLIRWDENFDTLKEIGYDGFLVCEAFGQKLEKLAAATKIWRKMFVSEEQLAIDALAFMKREVAKRWA